MSTQEDLTVEQALSMVLAGVEPLPSEDVPLADALGRVLAAPIVARDSLPPFANSSMDGYAVRAEDTEEAASNKPVSFNVLTDIAAGTVADVVVTQGTAARIMTGAAMPQGADAVVPVEDTNEPWRDSARRLPETVLIHRSVQPGDYVRPIGEDIEAGHQVLDTGHVLRPQEIGVLAALGVSIVPVHRRPRVGLLATGDELIAVEQPLQPGKIRNSNSYAQAAQIMTLGAEPISLGVAGDRESDVRHKLALGLEQEVDLFVSSAGVSVGAYDVVKAVLEKEGNIGFWRVRMRPGKPLAFGDYHGVPYLGLPGNPVSAMVSFERFVRPAIRKMAGFSGLDRPEVSVVLKEEITSDGRETYVRAVVRRTADGYEAVSTGSQGSNILTSLVKANALVIIPKGVRQVEAGTVLRALMIDWPETVF
ncbi:MAG: gephyrin-like molybdotransferase Glp [Candidatus Promineifilaceae bacterium]|jgi:molybdopterin molybdotransferase